MDDPDGRQRRYMPRHLLLRAACYQRSQRWIKAVAFEAIVHDPQLFILGRQRLCTRSTGCDHRRTDAPEEIPVRARRGRLHDYGLQMEEELKCFTWRSIRSGCCLRST